MKVNPNLGQSKNRTIIFTHGGGRFGNQMFSYAQLLAFALEHENIDFVNMACWEYGDLLETCQKDAICSKSSDGRKHIFYRFLYFFCTRLFIKNDSVAKNIILCLIYLFGGNPFSKYYSTQSIYVGAAWVNEKLLVAQKLQSIDLADSESLALINKADTTILAGWGLCDWNLVEKHQSKIREILKIRKKYFDVSYSFVAEKRRKYDFIVGIMMRQGDYKLWENGRYYFSSEQYSDWIDQLSELFQNRGRVGFLLASDTPQDLSKFNNKNTHFTTGIAGGKGHYIESLSQLSLCNVILSPPSSFSLWASFLGDIPVIQLLDSQQVMGKKDLLDRKFFDCVGNFY